MKIYPTVKVRLKELLWVLVFFLILAAITLPVIFLSVQYAIQVDMTIQALIVTMATFFVLFLRKEPLTAAFGKPSLHGLADYLKGMLIGTLLMLLPALFLFVFGWIHWEPMDFSFSQVGHGTLLFIGVAVAEEMLFRGFIFQRFIGAFGQWPAQIIIAGYFTLIHLNNPRLTGTVRFFAITNIFLASIMFGLAVIRFKNISVAIGLHLMANWVQGTVLGFAVSGNSQSSFLRPIIKTSPVWLTGGEFGLEASLPGLTCVILAIILIYRFPQKTGQPIHQTICPQI